MHHRNHFDAVGLRQMIDHPIGELLQELAAVFLVQTPPCFGVVPAILQRGGQALLELTGQLLADAPVIGPGLNDFESGFAGLNEAHQAMAASSSAMTSSWL